MHQAYNKILNAVTDHKIINTQDPNSVSVAELNKCLNLTLPDATLEVSTLPGCQEIELALINRNFDTGPLAPEVMQAVIRNPAYWAFCWGSGLGLAQYLAKNRHWVENKTVIDLGSGCGIAAIAAVRAGARKVIAVDIDEQALAATHTNASLNKVDVETYSELAGLGADIILMADVLYDKSNHPLLVAAQKISSRVLVADSRIHDLKEFGFETIAELEALTYPNLGEFDEFRRVSIFVNKLDIVV